MQNTRDQIIQAASRLIHLGGFNSTSLDSILRESGVGKGGFYHYFSSKEELGLEILKRNFEAFSESVIDKAFRSPKPPLQQVFDFLDLALEGMRSRSCAGGCPLGNLALEMSDSHEGFRTKLQEAFEIWRHRIEDALSMKVDTQRDRSYARRLSYLIIASVEGGIMLARLHRDIGVLEICTQELKRYLRSLAEPD